MYLMGLTSLLYCGSKAAMTGLVALSLSFSPFEFSNSQDSNTKWNLDLPYNSSPSDETEENMEYINYLGSQVPGKTFVWVLDYSNSMKGTKIDILRKETEKSIQELKSNSYFNIILFNETYNNWNKVPVRATQSAKNNGVNFLRRFHPKQNTLISSPVMEAVDQSLHKNKDRAVLLVADGIPTRETIAESTKKIDRYNSDRTPIHTFLILTPLSEGRGSSSEVEDRAKLYMKTVADQNRGDFNVVRF
jgi:hypothetical protein